MTDKHRAHPVPPPAEPSEPNYSDSFAIAMPLTEPRRAEAWIREIFEGAPRPLRWFLLAGWFIALGFRPGPAGSSQHVLGWPISESTPEVVVLEQHSGLIGAHLTLHVDQSQILWTTRVDFAHVAARPIWAVVGILHRRIVPYLLERAVDHAVADGPRN
ncbi:DUF2867 domain-containing protein [Gordonia sp. (in: high G+C Gram-positive bacteria)]|uniref:DUF2867 domain-containing protein n=1 Tax=Gordonia sp. (in: high G+C Gram-positive bacteria) TaxID=84139 RepID=UPI003F9C3C68